MDIDGSGASRGGGDGLRNEDTFRVEEGLGLYLVCDGASESPAGEVAARVAARAVEEFVESATETLELRGGRAARAIVNRAMAYAIRALAQAELDEPKLAGLATTVTMLLVQGRLGVIGHRGDSRAYLIRREEVHQLTSDHPLTANSRAEIDLEADDFDVLSVDLRAHDTIILCTDGAEEVVRSGEFAVTAIELGPRALAERIVAAAARRDPTVDATAVVVRVHGGASAWLEIAMQPWGHGFGHSLATA